MDFTIKELLTAVIGSASLITIIGGSIAFLWDKSEKRNKEKALKEQEAKLQEAEFKRLQMDGQGKANEAVWRIVEERNKECERLNLVIDELQADVIKLKLGDSLAQPTITKLYRAIAKLGIEIDILDSVFGREFRAYAANKEVQRLLEATQLQTEQVKMRYEELNEILPKS